MHVGQGWKNKVLRICFHRVGQNKGDLDFLFPNLHTLMDWDHPWFRSFITL
jgi:hypothetical protein